MEQLNRTAIEQALEETVRPQLALHSGDIQIESLEDSVLRVRLLGQCSGCPSAELTMEAVVREELMKLFPELRQVVLVTGVSDALLEEARAILRQRHA